MKQTQLEAVPMETRITVPIRIDEVPPLTAKIDAPSTTPSPFPWLAVGLTAAGTWLASLLLAARANDSTQPR